MSSNTNNIQPPSFDDFNGSQYEKSYNTKDVSPVVSDTGYKYEKNIIESQNPAYGLPLSMVNYTGSTWFGLFSLALIYSAVVFTIILYSLFRVIQIRAAEREKFNSEVMSPQVQLLLGEDSASLEATSQITDNELKWHQVVRHSASENSNDWRLAIIEADIMLDELITAKGYTGEGLGEKLKQVRPQDLNSIEAAWEAHKVRNKIAHEGAAHELNQREIKRVINLYKEVFTEAKFI